MVIDSSSVPPASNLGFLTANLNNIFAPLYAERASSLDVVHFVAATGLGERRIIDSASQFVCGLHSDMIKAMLTSGMSEQGKREIELQAEFEDLWPDVVRFFYGIETAVPDFKACLTWIKLSDYYGITQLREQSLATLLKSTWSTEEAVMVITELGFDGFMVSRACTLLEKAPQALFDSVQWRSLGSSFVLHFLNRRLMCSEKCIFDAALAWYMHSNGSKERGTTVSCDADTFNKGQASDSHAYPQAEAQCPVGSCSGRSMLDDSAEVKARDLNSTSGRANDESNKKRRLNEGAVILPEHLRNLVLFEQMTLQELYACKQHIPFFDYVSYLETISKLVESKRGSRGDRLEKPSEHSSIRRCKHCLKDHPGASLCGTLPCKTIHKKEAVTTTQKVWVQPRFTKHRKRCWGCTECAPAHYEERNVTTYPCCQGDSGSIGCSPLEHDWESVWTLEVLR